MKHNVSRRQFLHQSAAISAGLGSGYFISGLPAETARIPWDGPHVRIIEHQAHASGHASLLIEERGVLIAGDMLSDVLIPLLDLSGPADPIEVSLRRTSELTARLMLASPVLVPDEEGPSEKVQFERIITGLAKQLRSNLERKLGRYSVDLPVFPPL